LAELFQNGAIEEVQNVHNKYGSLKNASMKTLGVPEIINYLAGHITYDKAIEIAATNTRHYAKRQCTWFNHQVQKKKILTFSSMQEV
jgi:tRNA dimethylallyltransferase